MERLDEMGVDTLSSGYLDDDDFPENEYGINTISVSNFTDVVQRMATSTYIFKLRGYAARMGFRVPIPGLRTVAGVAAFPAERQYAANWVTANFNGVPMYNAKWDLWYYVTVPPWLDEPPPDNLANHIAGDQQLPEDGLPPMVSFPDWNAVSNLKPAPDMVGGIPVDKPLGN